MLRYCVELVATYVALKCARQAKVIGQVLFGLCIAGLLRGIEQCLPDEQQGRFRGSAQKADPLGQFSASHVRKLVTTRGGHTLKVVVYCDQP